MYIKIALFSMTCSDYFTGFCFQVNSDQELTSQAPGLANGVTLLLNVEVVNYMAGPKSYSEGFYVCVNTSIVSPITSRYYSNVLILMLIDGI